MSILDFIVQPWVAYPAMIGFALFTLWAIAGVVWYWPGDNSCLAAEWKAYRAEKKLKARAELD